MKGNKNQKKIYDLKTLLVTYIKRYLIVLCIAAPIILILNYALSEVSWYSGALPVVFSLGLLLLACFIGLIVFNKIDEKRENSKTKESERDPFSD